MQVFSRLPRSFKLLPLAATLFCASAFAAPADGAPALAPKGSAALLELLKAPPVLKERASALLGARGVSKPAHNAYTNAVQKEGKRTGREIEYDMLISYANGEIYNPATGKKDKVRLRSYNGQFVAPIVVMKPGQTVRFNLMNQLPAQPDSCATADPNTPAPNGCFNVTNLHSHGLWVSPTGNSDNVLLSINPGVNFEYEYNVPTDHPAGTFWYHPHKHGSTAMQVASGMAGTLVVKGSRYPTKDSNGDVDTLLKSFEPANGTQGEVMMFYQIPYACFNDANQSTVNTSPTGIWICNDNQVGVVENFNVQVGNPNAWATSGRYTLINGQARPQIPMEAGRLYRWRLVDAGFNETLQLRIRKVGNANNLKALLASGNDKAEEVSGACNGVDVTQFEVATDGLTHSQVIAKTINTLQPGYRSDILFSLPEKGLYCVYSDTSPAGSSVSAGSENPKVLAIIDAGGNGKVGDQAAFVTEQLVKAAQKQPADVRAQVTADLKANLKLTKFVPHPPITDAEIKASNQPPVNIQFNLIPGSNTKPTQFLINNEAYKPNVVNQTLILGAAQTWNLSSLFANHPFHIHVNPFEIVSIKKQTPGPIDPQYKDLVGTWKDTLMVIPGYDIEVRSRYERYIGEFVLHCHILEHEDQGMMQNVQIVLPDGKGGAQKAGHH